MGAKAEPRQNGIVEERNACHEMGKKEVNVCQLQVHAIEDRRHTVEAFG